jgi:hypothetical protein
MFFKEISAMKKLALVLGVLGAFAAGQAAAQTNRHEISAFGSWAHYKNSGQTTNVNFLDLDYGYYFTPQFVGTIGASRFSTDGTGSTDVMLGGKYYFGVGRRGNFVPFVDGALGTSKSAGERARRWEFGGGLSYFVTEATSFDVGIEWFRIKHTPTTSGTLIGMGFTTRF